MTMSENKILKVEEFSPKLISLEKGRGQEFTKKPEKQEDLWWEYQGQKCRKPIRF